MSEYDDMRIIPDEMLEQVVGGALNKDERAFIQTVAQQLKDNGYPFKNAIAWLSEQTAGYRFSDEDWGEIVGITQSVYGL